MQKIFGWILRVLGLRREEKTAPVLPEPQNIIEPPKMKPPKKKRRSGIGSGMTPKPVTKKPYPSKQQVRELRNRQKQARRITRLNAKH